jgi:hypothetical protein
VTSGRGMRPARRRLIPGTEASHPPAIHPTTTPGKQSSRPTAPTRSAARRSPERHPGSEAADRDVSRRPSKNYAATRLVNFRLPTDLHDRYKQLVHEVEERFPRLRHPSLTELIIALLEEGPADAAEVAELIRRKRAGEHGGSP